MDEDMLNMLTQAQRDELQSLLETFLDGVEELLPEGWHDWAIPGYEGLVELRETIEQM